MTQQKIRFGFKSKNQLPLFMLWKEYRDSTDNVVFGEVIFSSKDMFFHFRKFAKTLRIISCLAMARTFGKYHYTIYDPTGINMAKYSWRGKYWLIPNGPVEKEFE